MKQAGQMKIRPGKIGFGIMSELSALIMSLPGRARSWFLSPKEMRNSPTHSLARPKSEILVEIEKVVQKNKKRLKEEIIENHLPEGYFDQMKDDRLPPNWNLMTHKGRR